MKVIFKTGSIIREPPIPFNFRILKAAARDFDIYFQVLMLGTNFFKVISK